MISLIMTKFPNQPKEEYYGNREYKLILDNNSYYKSIKKIYKSNIDNPKQKNQKKIEHNNLISYKKNRIEHKKLQKRATQMLFRINEGRGKAIYIIGIDDNGISTGIPIKDIQESIKYLELMKLEINATINNYRIYFGEKGFILTARVTMLPFNELLF